MCVFFYKALKHYTFSRPHGQVSNGALFYDDVFLVMFQGFLEVYILEGFLKLIFSCLFNEIFDDWFLILIVIPFFFFFFFCFFLFFF